MRIPLAVLASAVSIVLAAGFMYAFRDLVFSLGLDFAAGAVFGIVLMVVLQWSLWDSHRHDDLY